MFVLAVAQTFSVKKFLVISQNSQKNTCARVTFWISLLKKRIWHRSFPANFVKFRRKPFLQNNSGRPLVIETRKSSHDFWEIFRKSNRHVFFHAENITLVFLLCTSFSTVDKILWKKRIHLRYFLKKYFLFILNIIEIQ